MKTILVYEEGSVNEYALSYDQEYMNMCLEEYRKTFSLLRKGKCVINKNSSEVNLKKIACCMDEFVSMKVFSSDRDDDYFVSFVGAINPTVYNILNSPNGFIVDNSRIHALYAWYYAIKDNENSEERDLSLASFDYYNLDEKKDLHTNIASLFSDVSLEYVGSVDTPLDDDLIKARRNAIFVEEFSIRRNGVKRLKK